LIIGRKSFFKIENNLKVFKMKTPNYDDKVGKHPIPHAKGIAKDEKKNEDAKKKSETKKDKK
tara:strand:- start:989 stop:1174 length:186 start_codon:yes stop_codon:yes gene_type:complete